MKIFSLLFFLPVFLVSNFGVLIAANMHRGAVMNCPLMGQDDEMCPLGGIGAISAWQNFFAATRVGLFLLFILCFFLNNRMRAFMKNGIKGRVVPVREHPNIALYKYLLRLFSRGILHPKLDA